MKRVCTFLLLTALAVSMAACGGAAENKPANTANTNTKPAAPAAPTAEMLLGMEKQANEAYAKGDGTYFESMLSDKMIMSMGKDHMNKAGVVAHIKTAKCEMPDGVKLSEPQLVKIDNDTYAFAYKNETTGKCNEGGKMVDMKPTRAATVWVRNGEKWQAAWHAETEIMMPKGDAKKEEAKKDEAKKAMAAEEVGSDSAKADAKKEAPKKAEAKKEEPKKDEAKKEDVAKKDDAKKDDKAAASDAAPSKPVASANTDALVKLHQAGWEAWKNKDAKWFEQNTAANLAFIDPAGNWFGTKADTIKLWTEGMKCEGVTKVSVTDGFGWALSPTVEILEHKGTADGTCDGQKNGPLWGSAVYVKEGNDWKLAFMLEMPAKS